MVEMEGTFMKTIRIHILEVSCEEKNQKVIQIMNVIQFIMKQKEYKINEKYVILISFLKSKIY